MPLTTLFWTGADDNLGHEYQFSFDLPQLRTAFQRTLDSTPPPPKAEPMPEPAAPHRPAPHPRRAARIAWRTGWVPLALVAMALTYGALVVAGR